MYKILAFIATFPLLGLYESCMDASKHFGLVSETGVNKFVTVTELHYYLTNGWAEHYATDYQALLLEVPQLGAGGTFGELLGHSSHIQPYQLVRSPNQYHSVLELRHDDIGIGAITRHINEVGNSSDPMYF